MTTNRKQRQGVPARHKPGMLAHTPSKGLERDSQGRPIPMAKRLPEDRAKAKKASSNKAKAAGKKVKKKKK